MISIPTVLLGRFILSAVFAAFVGSQAASVSVRQPDVDFGKVVRGAVVEATFTLVNDGDSPLQIDKVRLTPPLLPAHVLPQIPPRQEATLRIRLDTQTLDGPYDGAVLLSFNDPKLADLRLTVTGRVILPIEVSPPAVFATAQRGETNEVSVEIVNHETEPVMLGAARYPPERFTTRLETIEEGRRFRLTLALNPNGPAGKNKELILVRTSSASVPELRIPAFTYLRERVYTFPEFVELGTLRLDEIARNPDLLKNTAQTLMVYRKGTSDFQVKVSSDVPGLTISAERGPLGDRYQLTVSLQYESIRAGKISGSIFVETNDPEFPKLTVPVSGEIAGRAGGQ